MKTRLENREQAGLMLSHKLKSYRRTDTVILGIPHGGVLVAAVIASELEVPLQILPCRRIKHPADETRCLGCVCPDEVFTPDLTYGIPQSYISHQVALHRAALRSDHDFYNGDTQATALRGKTVILVDDILKSGESVIACLRSIQKQKPLKVVLAIPVVSVEAAYVVGAMAELVFLRMEPAIRSGKDHYVDFPDIDDNRVKQLFEESTSKLEVHASK
ncbi:MAG TPA: phosphoribosyltransferase family protein [Chryseosolibacter sp.]